MKTKTLRQIERAKLGLVRVLERAMRADPNAHEVRELLDGARKDWCEWYKRLKRVEVAAAEKRDKGEVLFTIFYPDSSGAVRSIIRTPHRLIRRWETLPWYYRQDEERDYVEVRRADDWKWDFQYHSAEARKAADRIRERKAAKAAGAAA